MTPGSPPKGKGPATPIGSDVFNEVVIGPRYPRPDMREVRYCCLLVPFEAPLL